MLKCTGQGVLQDYAWESVLFLESFSDLHMCQALLISPYFPCDIIWACAVILCKISTAWFRFDMFMAMSLHKAEFTVLFYKLAFDVSSFHCSVKQYSYTSRMDVVQIHCVSIIYMKQEEQTFRPAMFFKKDVKSQHNIQYLTYYQIITRKNY